MSTPASTGHSKTRVNRAGDRLRDWWISEVDLTDGELYDELDIVDAFRGAHRKPLTRVAAGLRWYVKPHSPIDQVIIAQRLKRLRTIIDKLRRHPEMSLARMQDVGGCRSVLPTQAAVDAVVVELQRQRRWDIRAIVDYARDPKPSGYRAVHVIVRKDGCLIEIQLRTPAQHGWSELIERVDRTGQFGVESLKTSEAPADVMEYYRLGADLLDAQSRGEEPNTATLKSFRRLNARIESYRQRAREG